MFTHANIKRPGCTSIVIHVAISITAGDTIDASWLQRNTSRVTTLNHQTPSIDPVGENKLVFSCIQIFLQGYKKGMIRYKNEGFARTT